MRIAQPKPGEPIRLLPGPKPRYRAVLDVAPPGAPRRQVTKTFATISAARDWVTETRTRVSQGNYTAPTKVTLRQVADDWLNSRRDIRQRTRDGYSTVLAPILDKYGDRPVQSFTRRDLDQMVDWMDTEGGTRGKGLAHRSQVYALATLRQVLDYAASVGVIAVNPARDVKVRRRTAADRAQVAVWTPEELVRFRDAADRHQTPWVRVGFRLTLCGLRRSEVLGLRWSDVDLDAGTVTISQGRTMLRDGTCVTDDPKSAASARTVPVEAMHAGTTALLKTFRALQAADRLAAGEAWQDTGLVVVDTIGNGVRPDGYSVRFRGLCATAKVPVIRLHAVRHSLASTLHAAGVAPASAARLLGHEIGTHLGTYVTSTDTAADTAAQRLAEVLSTAR